MPFRSINPANGQLVAEYPEASPAEVAVAPRRSFEAFREWSAWPLEKRSQPIHALGELLRSEAAPLAVLAAREMGKPVTEGQAEILKCAWTCQWMAAEGPRFLEGEDIPLERGRARLVFRPLGTVLALMPWNFPFWQVIRATVPALLAGNVVILKHASNVQGCARALQSLFDQAGFPQHAFLHLPVGAAAVPGLLAHPLVSAVTLTGGVETGREVAALAGGLLKKSVLELGGSDPYVILADADLGRAARLCATARLVNGGQSCIAAKRFIVEQPVREEFTDRLTAEMASVNGGDPLDPQTRLGPLARPEIREALHAQVLASIAMGARLRLGGEIPSGDGCWYPPTILDRVRPGLPVADQETFGPVAAIFEARDAGEAFELANATRFGLGAALFTADVAKGLQLASERLPAGLVAVNDMVRSDPRLPFGGIRESGYGRELGACGVREFTNLQTIFIGS